MPNISQQSSIGQQEVEHIAQLSRLCLSEKQAAKMQKELAVILNYINLLKEVNTDDVEPTAHSLKVFNVERVDQAELERAEVVDDIRGQFPQKENGSIKVKQVL